MKQCGDFIFGWIHVENLAFGCSDTFASTLIRRKQLLLFTIRRTGLFRLLVIRFRSQVVRVCGVRLISMSPIQHLFADGFRNYSSIFFCSSLLLISITVFRFDIYWPLSLFRCVSFGSICRICMRTKRKKSISIKQLGLFENDK